MSQKNQKIPICKKGEGFTLVEIMTALIIIGIISVIVSSIYVNYSARSRFTAVIAAMDYYKKAVELCFNLTGTLTGCDAGANGVPDEVYPAEPYVSRVTVMDGGNVWGFAEIGHGLNGESYVLRPALNSVGEIMWTVDTAQSTCLGVSLC
jgi:type IV pilus assembly protein PilA